MTTYPINPAVTRGCRSVWEAEAELDFGPRYRTLAAAREGVRVWSAVCQDSMATIERALAAGNDWMADREAMMLAGHRAELEQAQQAVAMLTELDEAISERGL